MTEADILSLLFKNENPAEPYWTKMGGKFLYEEVCQQIDIIDGKFKGAQSCKVDKKPRMGWKNIHH